MKGLMMDFPLTLRHVVDRAATQYSGREIVSRRPDGTFDHLTYGGLNERVVRLADALRELGVAPGDRVASLCWNHREHLELYFGPALAGAVLHTLNPRLHPRQIADIANHAEDAVLVADASLLPLLEELRPQLRTVRTFVVIDDGGDGRPEWGLPYEELVTSGGAFATLPDLQEDDAAALCYTSGTTSDPRGVLYTHRSIVLHSLVQAAAGVLGVHDADVVMPIVPMFHANAWGFPYTATLLGARQVLPGPDHQPAGLIALMEQERVTVTAAVPTIWVGVLNELDRNPGASDLSSVRLVKCGGSAAPESLIAGFERHGLRMVHGWGMTEMSPLGTISVLKPGMEARSAGERLATRAAQGFAIPFVDMKALDDDGREIQWDGKAMGELLVRGPWVAREYYQDPEATSEAFTEDGWFRTGDIVTIDPDGYVRIVDRAKDLVKSGGEWISSIEVEGVLMSHPSVREAVVIAVPDPRWGERPLGVVALRDGNDVAAEDLKELLTSRFPKWWVPDELIFVDDIPKTSVGKFRKSLLRERFRERRSAP